VVALLMPVYAFAHNAYFTIRSGGRTFITFLFDSAFTWGVCVPVAYILANFTVLPIVPIYLLIQSLEFVKCIVGFVLIKKGVWVRNLVASQT
jgi:Na+-driven multidrug efflux pump